MKHYSSALPTLALTVIQKEGPRWTWGGGTHVSLASLVNPSSQGRPLAIL